MGRARNSPRRCAALSNEPGVNTLGSIGKGAASSSSSRGAERIVPSLRWGRHVSSSSNSSCNHKASPIPQHEQEDGDNDDDSDDDSDDDDSEDDYGQSSDSKSGGGMARLVCCYCVVCCAVVIASIVTGAMIYIAQALSGQNDELTMLRPSMSVTRADGSSLPPSGNASHQAILPPPLPPPPFARSPLPRPIAPGRWPLPPLPPPAECVDECSSERQGPPCSTLLTMAAFSDEHCNLLLQDVRDQESHARTPLRWRTKCSLFQICAGCPECAVPWPPVMPPEPLPPSPRPPAGPAPPLAPKPPTPP